MTTSVSVLFLLRKLSKLIAPYAPKFLAYDILINFDSKYALDNPPDLVEHVEHRLDIEELKFSSSLPERSLLLHFSILFIIIRL